MGGRRLEILGADANIPGSGFAILGAAFGSHGFAFYSFAGFRIRQGGVVAGNMGIRVFFVEQPNVHHVGYTRCIALDPSQQLGNHDGLTMLVLGRHELCGLPDVGVRVLGRDQGERHLGCATSSGAHLVILRRCRLLQQLRQSLDIDRIAAFSGEDLVGECLAQAGKLRQGLAKLQDACKAGRGIRVVAQVCRHYKGKNIQELDVATSELNVQRKKNKGEILPRTWSWMALISSM